MNLLLLVTVVLAAVSCTSVSVQKFKVLEAKPANCEVNMFSSKEEALKTYGDIEEVCLISSQPPNGFDVTFAAAIGRGRPKACECGVTDVYIKEEHQATISAAATVTMIGFRKK